MRKKTLQELTIIDNFMFGAVMMIPENCKRFLELALGIEISRVEVSKEKSIVYNPEYKGIRLDIYAKDENSTHYNVEMQAVQKAELTRRSRYYHSQIDMELLLAGISYKELPDTYVIFICNFDPFGEEKYQYTLRQMCEESQGIDVGDGAHTIFFSTCGRNHTEVSKGLVAFLEYVRTPLVECERDFEDDYVSQLQSSVKSIKVNREMGARHMIFQEMLADEREEGRIEGRIEGKLSARIEDILEFLESLGTVSQELKVRIQKEKDMETLKRWNKLAAKVESINEFQEKM